MKMRKYDWFNTGFDTYIPCSATIDQLKNQLNGIEIQVVIDVECLDVQQLIPKLIRVFFECDYTKFKIYYVSKSTLPFMSVETQSYISNVPTIILKRNKIVVATIVERLPDKTTIEKELEKVLNIKNKKYENE